MQERRAAERLRIDLNARWEALRTQGRGAVCDLSALGCFVLTTAEVNPGELIRLEVNFPQEVGSLWGQVVYVVAEMGFALRFAITDEAERGSLARLIESMNQH
jgi:PilZ domain